MAVLGGGIGAGGGFIGRQGRLHGVDDSRAAQGDGIPIIVQRRPVHSHPQDRHGVFFGGRLPVLRFGNPQLAIRPFLFLKDPAPGTQTGQLLPHHLPRLRVQIGLMLQFLLICLTLQFLSGGENQRGIDDRGHIGGIVKGELHAEDELPELGRAGLDGLTVAPGLPHGVEDLPLVRVGGPQAQLLPHELREPRIDELPQDGGLVPGVGARGDGDVLERAHQAGHVLHRQFGGKHPGADLPPSHRDLDSGGRLGQ